MKKTLIITRVALGAIAMASSAFATIAGSAHDLSTGATSGLSACEYCHTPHNAVSALGTTNRTPLWNRSNPAASTFTGYGATVGGTNIPIDGSTVGVNSLTCLSCHDGVTYTNTVANGKLSGTATLATSTANIGKNLNNDHPVGFTFQAGRAGVAAANFEVLVAGSTNSGWNGSHGFRLYGSSTFECASCHDPHDTSTGGLTVTAGQGRSDYFLRSPWSTICTDCHAK